MKLLVSCVIFLMCCLTDARGQIGNEWISFDQRYLKIPVASEGLYRIAYSDLEQAGFPINAHPRSIQLFHRGTEVAILVQGESDGIFDPDDYIEFYGKANDGVLDSGLYEVATHQPHRYYNLYSDTTSYFLTYGGSTGRRVQTFTTSNEGLAPKEFHLAESMLVLKESYSAGVDYGNVHKTVFDEGEGWMGRQILHGQERSYTLSGILETAPASANPVLEVLLTGRGPMPHNVEVYAAGRLLATVSFRGYASQKFIHELQWNDVDAAGNVLITIRATGAGGPDRVSANYIRLTFPQKISMSANRFFNVESSPEGAYLTVGAPVANTRLFDVSDPTSVLHVDATLASTLNAVIPPADGLRRIMATADAITPVHMKPVSFRQIDPNAHNYVIITHPSLRKPAQGYLDPVKAYGEYRSLPEAGGFDTLLLNIDQVYDQFNYGETSPRAIFQLMKFFASGKLPDYLFLIGKGLDVNYGYWRQPSAFTTYRDLVPTAGFPGSDMAFTAEWSPSGYTPAVATGRLAAISPADVAAYLNKVKDRDKLPFNDLRRKKLLHLSGGIENNEPVVFKNILRDFEPHAESIYLGGDVQAIAKQSTDIKLINVAGEVNAGLALITFFGHSAPNTLDFDIGLVTDPLMGYNNEGKYPFMLMNGCNAGSFFLNTAIPGENWINTPDKGAVGFIAHSAYGLLSGLQRYSSTFYKVAFSDSMFVNEGIGNVQQEVAERYIESFGSTPLGISQVQQMVLLGDPVVKLFGAEKPDYAPDPDGFSVSSFYGEPITALTDSFRLNIPLRNFGIAHDKLIRLEVTREFQDEVLQYDTVISATLFSDTIQMVMRAGSGVGYGMNTFTIEVDADNNADELNEANNIATFEYFIPLNGTKNLFPYNYSIVDTTQLDLTFQYTDQLADPREYLLQIDTAGTFSSGFFQEFQMTSRMLVRQPIQLLERDSTVYYWRTRLATPQGDESREWMVSSFVYVKNGPEGWAQMRIPQYTRNSFSGLVTDPEIHSLKFLETVTDLAIKTFSSSALMPRDSVSVRIDGVEFNLLHEGAGCRDNTINLIAFDRNSTQPYPGIYLKWYQILYEYGGRRLLCGREPYVINSFTSSELISDTQADIRQYVDNIDPGDSVVLFSIGDAGYELWPAAAREKLAELGISETQLANLKNGEATVIFGRKGSPSGTAQTYHASPPEVSLAVNRTITGRYSSGFMRSVKIGPAQRWERLVPKVERVEAPDTYSFDVMGIRMDGTSDTLLTNLQSEQDLTSVAAADYPYLEIIFRTQDDIDLTAVQLSYWLVIYEPVADGVALYNGPATSPDLREGQVLERQYAFINISNKNFSDSLDVKYDLVNAENPHPAVSTIKIAPPAPSDTTFFSVPFTTVGKGGLNNAEVFVNPEILAEHDYDNNVVKLRDHVTVLTDSSDPVIDATVDGRHIRHNELVAANPLIVIKIWDENPFLLMRDTVGVRLYMAYQCETDVCQFEPVFFSRDDVQWVAASDVVPWQAHFRPKGLPSGRYILRVDAADRTGNASGASPFELAFRIDNESPVSISAPYPNPFQGETTFEITIPGDEETSYTGHLDITTANGTAVMEERLSGNLHAGLNRLVWKVNASGELLPPGLYFYRFLVVGGGTVYKSSGKLLLKGQ